MTEGGLVLLVFVFLAALLLARVPIAFGLGLTSFAYCFATGTPLIVVVRQVSTEMSETTLLAIPFFVLCGEILSAGGMANRLIDLAHVCVGFFRGGLALVHVMASMFFGGIAGSSVTDTSSIGSRLIPKMVERGYPRDFSVAVTVTSSTQGFVVPPSFNAVLYALAVGSTVLNGTLSIETVSIETVSIPALFLAGYVPTLLIGLTLAILCYVMARQRGYPAETRLPTKEVAQIAVDAIPALLTPLIIIIPTAMGKLAVHQTAAIAVLWAALVSTVLYEALPWRRYGELLRRSARTSGMVLILVGTAAAFSWVLNSLDAPTKLAAVLTSLTDSRWALLLAIHLLLLVLGAIIDMAPLIVITTPILLPLATDLGLDPIHFGVILLLNLAIGSCTPPVGSTLFVGSTLGGIPIEKAVRGLWPFYIAMLVILMVVTYVPAISLWLPSWLLP